MGSTVRVMFFEIRFEFLLTDDVIYSTFYQSNNQSKKTRIEFSLFVLEYGLKNGPVKIIINMEIIKMGDDKKRKNPTLALILSAIFPGLGQIYVMQIPKGVILIVLNLIINYLLINPLQVIMESGGSTTDMSTLYIVLGYTVAGLILWIYAIIDAKRTAERMNKELEA